MNHLTRLRRRPALIIAVVLLLVLIAVPAAIAGSGGRDTPPAPPGTNVPIVPTSDPAAPGAENHQAPALHPDPDYWTEERMREASGAPMPTDS